MRHKTDIEIIMSNALENDNIKAIEQLFKEWECTFTIEVINEDLDKTILKEILESAGKFKGVWDFRPEFGRFIVTKFEEIK